jgi:hypothetical protein
MSLAPCFHSCVKSSDVLELWYSQAINHGPLWRVRLVSDADDLTTTNGRYSGALVLTLGPLLCRDTGQFLARLIQVERAIF